MTSLPDTRAAVHLTAHGGYDVLAYRAELPIPALQAGEVLIRMHAAGINNTDINTRIGWYDDSVTGDTNSGAAEGFQTQNRSSSWTGSSMQFPRIQGADLYGEIVACGAGVSESRLGEKTVASAVQWEHDSAGKPLRSITFGSECDGAFTTYAVVRGTQCYDVQNSTLSAHQIAAVPCAYSTALNMLFRVEQSMGWRDFYAHGGDNPLTLAGKRVLVTGASGGVGYAACEQATLLGAEVTAVVGASKMAEMKDVAAHVLARPNDDQYDFGDAQYDVVVDVVGGQGVIDAMVRGLVHGGYYITSGAIAGPIATIDLRKLYLRDLSYLGATYQHPTVFPRVVSFIRENKIAPKIGGVFALANIVEAQKAFVAKSHVGKLVIEP